MSDGYGHTADGRLHHVYRKTVTWLGTTEEINWCDACGEEVYPGLAPNPPKATLLMNDDPGPEAGIITGPAGTQYVLPGGPYAIAAPGVRYPGSWMPRDHDTGEAVKAILGLPDDHWLDVTVSFATDGICTAVVTLSIDREQAVALAGLLRNAEAPT